MTKTSRTPTSPRPTEPKSPAQPHPNPWLAAALICGLIAIAYFRVWSAGFVWDDDAHVTPLALRSLRGLARIWTEPGVTQQYYPLLHSWFWVQARLWGDASTGYHVVNPILHASTAVLLALTLRRLGLRGAWTAAAIFAVHPVMVESVAWISEQKNTLSAVLYFAAGLAYLGFDSRRAPRWYALALALFFLALCAKTVTATLPAALLVVFWWQRGSLGFRRDVLPLLPWFALSAAAAFITTRMEHTSIGAAGEAYAIGGLERILIAGRAAWFYLGKLLFPANLIFIYPRWEIDRARAIQYLAPAALVAVVAVAWLFRGRSRGPLATVLLYVGTLFPALGFIDVFPFQYSFVADHFQYLAAPVVISSLVALSFRPGLDRSLSRSLRIGIAGVGIAGAMFLTVRQTAAYANADTLWRVTLMRNPGCWMAKNNLAADLLQMGHLDEALPLVESSVGLAPRNAPGRINLGQVRLLQGRVPEAIGEFRRAIEIAPSSAEAHAGLATALLQSGAIDEAAIEADRAVALRPGLAQAWTIQGNVNLAAGRLEAAAAAFQRALALDPTDSTARTNRGTVLARQGRLDEAVGDWTEAARIDPRNAVLQVNLGTALLQAGRANEALPHFERAIELQPRLVAARFTRALALVQLGRDGEAESGFRAVLALEPDHREAHRQLGALLYRRGELDAARRELEQAGPAR